MNICRDCKFRKQAREEIGYYGDTEWVDKCDRTGTLDLVTGERDRRHSCQLQRYSNLPWHCGRKGRYFQPKDKP